MFFKKYIETKIKESALWKNFQELNCKYKDKVESTVPYSKCLNCASVNDFNAIDILEYLKNCLKNPNNAIHCYIRIAKENVAAWISYQLELNNLLSIENNFSKSKRLNEKYKCVLNDLVKNESLKEPHTIFTVQKMFYSDMHSNHRYDCRKYSLSNILELY